jgi:hypothetical protein
MVEELPIIEKGVVIDWDRPADGTPAEDKVIIKSMYSDEDGNVQVRIEETAPDAPEGPRTVDLESIHDQLLWRDYQITEV